MSWSACCAKPGTPCGWHEPVCPACQPGARVHPPLKTPKHSGTATPSSHVIVIIGENEPSITCSPPISPSVEKPSRTCCQKASSILMALRPNFSLASQSSPTTPARRYQLTPSGNARIRYFRRSLPVDIAPHLPECGDCQFYENGLPDNYYVYMTTGGTGLNHGDVDTRVPNATTLPLGRSS